LSFESNKKKFVLEELIEFYELSSHPERELLQSIINVSNTWVKKTSINYRGKAVCRQHKGDGLKKDDTEYCSLRGEDDREDIEPW